MIIKLWENNVPFFNPLFEDIAPSIIPFLINDNKTHPAIIICPGGAYIRRSSHEGETVAKWLNSIGISSFVLNYRVHPYKYPANINDLIRAVKLVRSKANEFKISSDKIGVMGFSAGGHLVSILAVHGEKDYQAVNDYVDNFSSKPDVLILCYPVIDLINFGHSESIKNLLGENNKKGMLYYLSTHYHVNKSVPPTFLWHTFEDSSVPIENSLLFAFSLKNYMIPFELHIFQHGRHGLGIKEELNYTLAWKELCVNWLKSINFL